MGPETQLLLAGIMSKFDLTLPQAVKSSIHVMATLTRMLNQGHKIFIMDKDGSIPSQETSMIEITAKTQVSLSQLSVDSGMNPSEIAHWAVNVFDTLYREIKQGSRIEICRTDGTKKILILDGITLIEII